MAIVLSHNQYGKAQTRLVQVGRGGDRHELTDLTVTVTLAGDLAQTHLTGDNSAVLPTDSQKNTVYAFAARYGVGPIEQFGLRLARHFVDSQPTIHRARVAIEQHGWLRLGPHSFQRRGGYTRTASVSYDGRLAWVVSGVSDLVLLNSTDSQFVGFIRDPYTTLPESTDRILATEVSARWRHAPPLAATAGQPGAGAPPNSTVESGEPIDWDASFEACRGHLVAAFVDTYSKSLQQTLYAMGERVLAHRPEVAEVRLCLPNKHHLTVDLEPFGLDNPNEVFVATDRPYGLIEGAVLREGAPPPGLAWW